VEAHERKLLAFTDSVQDASHRASFFAGRTHRINLRIGMARLLGEQSDDPMTLAELGEELLHAAGRDPHRLFELVPPDLLMHPALRSLWGEKPLDRGRELLASRIGFEVDLEFGLRSRVGRTLELTGTAAAEVRPLDAHVVDLVDEDFRHRFPTLDQLDPDALEVYVHGLLERLRLRGALFHPLLDPYVEHAGQQWFVWGGRPEALPPFTPGQGRPLFATYAAQGDFDSLTALSATPTWFVDWAVRSLGVDPAVGRDLNKATLALLAATTDTVIERNSGGARVFGLSRHMVDVWDIPEPSSGVRCDTCGNRHPTPTHRIEDWSGTPCLRYRCPGRYRPDESRTSYYRRLYRSGITRRVVTGEHTGLLQRAAREELEQAFKAGTAPDAPNVLTATPTLEMGIDIGDLSAVMLTSVPATPANYIQRVGRAGRSSGNSLIATFVPTDSHGLYYLADPEAMLAGAVRPPSCHLDATDTLCRQFIAYLIDRAADGTLGDLQLPHQIGALTAKGLDDGSFLAGIAQAAKQPTHVEGFLALFGELLAPASAEHLRLFAASDIDLRLKAAVENWQSELRDLNLRRDRLNGALERAEEQAARTGDGEEAASLRGQRAAVIRRIQDLRDEYVLSALERLGLLPNYTLVDDGVTLRATLWRRDDNGEFHAQPYEYRRSARLAVSELAPGNSFYAGGHRHVIDALEIGTAGEPAYETWRLCPDCGYGAVESDAPVGHCPRCGAATLADVGTRYQMLRLRAVSASGPEERARVYDEDDERERLPFDVITTVDVDPVEVTGAWQLREQAFGAEFAHRARLRRINLGYADRKGETLPIAGHERHVTRFGVCRHCGAARDARDDQRGKRPERLHHGWCKVRSGKLREQWDPIVLFHELVTDAVRFLLPVSLFEIDQRLASFKGALLLGLREDFGGDPQHLEIVTADMPNRDGQGRRHFLVLYDSVPGGTGYLAKLADPDEVRRVLELARRAVAGCPCQGEGRAACHRCLLGVVDRHEYELVRRDLALSLLDDLLADWELGEPIATVAEVDIGLIEESELERRFKVALWDWAEASDHVQLSPLPGRLVDGRRFDALELRITTADGATIRYRIDEQEGLSTTPSTVPDFVIHRMDEPGPDVAVYLDGFQFHASSSHANLAEDARKRRGVRASGRLVWSLNWTDVHEFHTAYAADPVTKVPTRPLLSGQARTAAKAAHVQHHQGIDFDAVDANPMAMLLAYLARPDLAVWEGLALSAITGAAATASRNVLTAVDVAGALTADIGGRAAPAVAPGGDAYGMHFTAQTANDSPLGLLLRTADPLRQYWTAVLTIDDDSGVLDTADHRRRWHDWLQWSNLLQFLRSAGRDAVICAASEQPDSLLDGLYVTTDAAHHLGHASPATAAPSVGSVSADMEGELDLVEDDPVRVVVRSLLEAGAPDFVAGPELRPDLSPPEAAWPEHRVAIVASDWDGALPDGWERLTPAEVDVSALAERLRGGV
jgi:hypothetical protein